MKEKLENIIEIILKSIFLYLIGSLFAGTFNVSEWIVFERIILGFVWFLMLFTD